MTKSSSNSSEEITSLKELLETEKLSGFWSNSIVPPD